MNHSLCSLLLRYEGASGKTNGTRLIADEHNRNQLLRFNLGWIVRLCSRPSHVSHDGKNDLCRSRVFMHLCGNGAQFKEALYKRSPIVLNGIRPKAALSPLSLPTRADPMRCNRLTNSGHAITSPCPFLRYTSIRPCDVAVNVLSLALRGDGDV